jgi:hypothetical protein
MRKNKIDKYHKQTLDKINDLYKYLYNRQVCAAELSDQPDEAFAYIQVVDDIKEAYRKFKDSICPVAKSTDEKTATDKDEFVCELDGTMDIHSKEDYKVKYTGKNGDEFDKELANKHLEINRTYTVLHTHVTNWDTRVFLKEIPCIGFNSVHFVNV